jgi:glycosyltransferase involved in cell wall biosynthesis
MSRLLGEDAQLRFRVFGSGWAEAQIRAAFPPEVQGRIDVAPKLSNDALADALARCKIFFFPSRYEGYGMAVAEAMACGCAAVTTPTGLGGSLRDGIDARICAVGDAAAFATALRWLLQNDAQREALAGQGRKRAAAFNWQRQCAELDSLYTGWVRARSTEPVSQ